MKHVDAELHVRGTSLFTDDLVPPAGTVYASVLASPVAHGEIIDLDFSEAMRQTGFVAALTARDIPGQNQIGNIIQDEPLLAEKEVHYVGQPVAVLIAESPEAARRARQAVRLEIAERPPVFDARQAAQLGHFIAPPRTFSLGNVEEAWSQCDIILTGQVESGGQEHVYLETQSALALPMENGGIKLVCATQSATAVQRIVARVLGLAMHRVEVEVPRLGGAFGGKEDQATAWACMAALAAAKLRRPVKLTLRRDEDMRMTGKRHPYSSDYQIGLTRDGKILAYEVSFYQNAGAAADLSTAILERTLFHVTNSYFIPNVRATAYSCRTNLPPNTAFRGFGAPQAMFVIESAIHRAAERLERPAYEIQRKNLLQEGDTFPYGMQANQCLARKCWEDSWTRYHVQRSLAEIREFNAGNKFVKQGLAVMPICFGISFTTTFLNQASALVHVYTDGSVSVTTAAVEMGQGVKTKIRQIASRALSIDPKRIRIEFTNTTRIANMSPTAASTGADMNGHATRIACETILTRLRRTAASLLNADVQAVRIVDEKIHVDGKETRLGWDELVAKAYLNRVNLSAHAHYATPHIYFDKSKEKGEPFAYHVYGTGIVRVTVDCLRGTFTIDEVQVVHDVGQSLNPLVDRGQMEGGIVQGLGWMTIEQVLHDSKGRLLTDTLTTYKVPDVHFAPEISCHFTQDSKNPAGPYHSKAIGEPPFMYGIAAYFAILNALKAFRPTLESFYRAPMTPETVLLALYRREGSDVRTEQAEPEARVPDEMKQSR